MISSSLVRDFSQFDLCVHEFLIVKPNYAIKLISRVHIASHLSIRKKRNKEIWFLGKGVNNFKKEHKIKKFSQLITINF